MKQQIKIYFSNHQDRVQVTYGLKMLVRKAIEATLSYEGYCNDCEVSVSFSDNAGIRELNRAYRNIDKETDVLSFPMNDYENDDGEPLIDEPENAIGDIVLSLEKAKAQADEFGHSFEREAAFLTVHSMLHLLGYDHETGPEDEADMRQRQREIMDGMGLSVKENATEERA